MERCPICRAMLNGAETCRRCRAELAGVGRVQRQAEALLAAAMHRLCLDDHATAGRLLRRARALHATPEVRALSWLAVRAAAMAAPASNGPHRSQAYW